MEKKKIFLASSFELQDDRERFEIFIGRKNKVWIDKGVFLELIIWEDFLDAMSQSRLQNEYNKAIRECDVFVMLFFTKVGKYTNEEFETAFGKFKQTNKPIIFIYFKDAEITTGVANREDMMSLFTFKDKLDSLGHFYTVYKNIDHLIHKFSQQLDKLVASGFIQFTQEKNNKKTSESRKDQERKAIAEYYQLFDSSDPREIQRGTIGLTQFVKDAAHVDDIYTAVRLRLASLILPSKDSDITTRTAQRQFQEGFIRPYIVFIAGFDPDRQKELYLEIVNNKSLKYARLEALDKLGDVRKLWDKLLSEPDNALQEALVFRLASHDYPFVDELLLQALKSGGSFIVVVAAARALGKRASENAVPSLIPLLYDSNEYIRQAAASALGSIGGHKSLVALEKAAKVESNEDVSSDIQSAIQRIKGSYS